MSLTGESRRRAGQGGRGGERPHVGMYAASAILAALQARATPAAGRVPGHPLFDTQVAWLANQGNQLSRRRRGCRSAWAAHPNIAPFQVFTPTATSPRSPWATMRSSAVLRCGRLPRAGRGCAFRDNAARVAQREALVVAGGAACACAAHASGWMRWPRSTCPAARSTTLPRCSTICRRAHALAFRMPHPELGPLPQLANPVRRNGEAVRRAAAAAPGRTHRGRAGRTGSGAPRIAGIARRRRDRMSRRA